MKQEWGSWVAMFTFFGQLQELGLIFRVNRFLKVISQALSTILVSINSSIKYPPIIYITYNFKRELTCTKYIGFIGEVSNHRYTKGAVMLKRENQMMGLGPMPNGQWPWVESFINVRESTGSNR